MSPYINLCEGDELSKSHVLLNKYDISNNGFLPQELPLSRLPDPLYTPWEDILSQLPELLKGKDIRRSIDELEVISAEELHTDEEWRRAYVVLSFLAHGYIWGGDGEKASEMLPPAISVPYLAVSEHLHLPPVATYASLNLWNFTTTSSSSSSSSSTSANDFSDLDTLKALHTFSGTEDESWFFTLSVAMESQGAHIIPVMLSAIDAIPRRDFATIAKGLDALKVCIEKLGRLLERMHEKCDPMVFYHQIRPYLAGSKNAEHIGLPMGVYYDEGNGRGSWRQLRGGSNGQSSLIQFLDVVLGVEHTAPGNGNGNGDGNGNSPAAGKSRKPASFHEEVRSYMPEPHRRFLEHVSRMDSLKDFAQQPAASSEQRRMQQSFHDATVALAEFRSKHMQMVTRYIVVPSRRQREAAAAVATAGSSIPHTTTQNTGLPLPLTGTGGTDLIPFLKQTREETLLAGMIPAEVVR